MTARSFAVFRDSGRSRSRKLDMVDAAERLDDLRWPPNNRLEALSGRPEGTAQHSDQ